MPRVYLPVKSLYLIHSVTIIKFETFIISVVILAEDQYVKEKLKNHDIHAQTICEVAPVEVQPARVLSHIYSYLGMYRKVNYALSMCDLW